MIDVQLLNRCKQVQTSAKNLWMMINEKLKVQMTIRDDQLLTISLAGIGTILKCFNHVSTTNKKGVIN